MNAPLGLPLAASAHAGEVDHTMVLVHILMGVLFVGWILFFLFALYRFRRKNNPVADYKGVTSHTSSWLEGGVFIAEVILLVGFSVPLWANRVDKFPAESERDHERLLHRVQRLLSRQHRVLPPMIVERLDDVRESSSVW